MPPITESILAIIGFMESENLWCCDSCSQSSRSSSGRSNRSSTNRWHFVADVWDLNGNFSIGKISQEKYDQELENASLWRDYVNNERQFPSKILVGEKN